MFSSSLLPYIIWYDKCYLLIHIIVEIHPLDTSMNYRWVHQSPPHPLLYLMMNSCFGTYSHSSSPENPEMSFRLFVLHLLFSDIPTLRYHYTNRIWISVRYDGWDNFPRVMLLALWWPGNRMSCLAPPTPGWRTYHYGLFARITVLLGGNCKTYVINCSWWIHWVSKNRPLLEDHVNAISKHVNGTPIFHRNIWSTMLNFIYHLS